MNYNNRMPVSYKMSQLLTTHIFFAGRSLLFFDQQDPGEVLTKNLETLKRKKGAGADTLHFDRRRENSDSEDDENDADRKPKRKKMKTSTGGTKSKPQTRGNSKK